MGQFRLHGYMPLKKKIELFTPRLGLVMPNHHDEINDPSADVSVQLKINFPVDLLPEYLKMYVHSYGYFHDFPTPDLAYT